MRVSPLLILLAASPLVLLTGPLAAELKLPQASPAATAVQELGITKVTVDYHRPAVKGRAVWGALVPYGEVWRLGANEATTLTVTHPVKLGGKDLPAGSYALFAIPGKDRWTLIVNRKAAQWGAYFRKESDDLFRLEVTPEAGPMVEWMTISLVPASETSIRLEWAWEKLRFSVPIEADVPGIVWKQIDEAVAAARPDDWAVLLQAARYARDTGKRLADGEAWLDRSIAIKEGFWNVELKARYLDDRGKTLEAIPLLRQAMALAEGKAPREYVEGLRKTEGEWQKKLGK